MKTIAMIAAAAASLAMAASPAAAQDLQVEVSYAGLDTASDAGAAVLAGRIESGIRTACQRQDVMLKSVAVCEKQMVANAVEQLKTLGKDRVAGNLASKI